MKPITGLISGSAEHVGHAGEVLVLHVCGHRPPAETSIREWIESTGCRVEACPNVYSALAHLNAIGAAHIDVVLVDVDELRADEFEFFALACAGRSDLHVWVYSSSGRESRVKGALARGATDRVEARRVSLQAAFGALVPAMTGEQNGSPSNGRWILFGRGASDSQAGNAGSEEAPLLTPEEIERWIGAGISATPGKAVE